MPTECIHGFDEGLCDICFPKAAVELPRSSRVVAPKRVASRQLRTSGSTGTIRPSRATAPPVGLLDQRVYHVTHVRNLDGILAAGAVLAADTFTTHPAESAAALAIEVDLSSPLTRELRATAEVGPPPEDAGSSSVAAHVPWYLSPDASVWQEQRRGAAEPRWSAAARAAASVDFVVLVTTVRALVGVGGFAVADGDAAATFTRFETDQDQTMRMLSRLHSAEQLRDAEVLVAGSVPFSAVQLVGVANDPQRDRVRGMLDAASARPKVAVYPPWFAVPE